MQNSSLGVHRPRHLAILAFVLAALCGQPLHAAVVFTFTDNGTDITVNWSGSLNTSGLTVDNSGDPGAFLYVGYNSPTNHLIALMTGSPKLRFDTPFTSITQFATSSATTAITNVTGDLIGLHTFGADLFLPAGYTSGAALSGSFQILNQTIASMGVVATPNAFVLSNGDTVSISLGNSSNVPERGQIATSLLLSGFAGYAALRRRKQAAR
jgi:hypothetical protein